MREISIIEGPELKVRWCDDRYATQNNDVDDDDVDDRGKWKKMTWRVQSQRQWKDCMFYLRFDNGNISRYMSFERYDPLCMRNLKRKESG